MRLDSDGFLELPTESEILPGLWMGGTDESEVIFRPMRLPVLSAPRFYDAVVTLDSFSQPYGWLVKEFRFGFPDAPLDATHAIEIEKLADWAYQQWKSNSRILIRCQAGLNRSGLVTGLVLLRDGKTFEETVGLIRSKRGPIALSNSSFYSYLENWKLIP